MSSCVENADGDLRAVIKYPFVSFKLDRKVADSSSLPQLPKKLAMKKSGSL